MENDKHQRVEAELAAAEAEVAGLRQQSAALAELDDELSDGDRATLRALTTTLGAARERLRQARAAAKELRRNSAPYGFHARGAELEGTMGVLLPPGTSSEDREKRIHAALGGPLTDAALDLGAVLAADPINYVRERPGRDPEGLTVLEIRGKVEGDRLVPNLPRRPGPKGKRPR